MPASPSEAILFVDGYNMVGAWPHLIELRDREGLESARRELIELLLSYSAAQNFDTQIVFDAQYRDTPGSREVMTSYLSVYYTEHRQTADTFIEKSCAAFRKDLRKFSHRLIVATSDRAQQLTVIGYGAEWMSAQRLWVEVELSANRVRHKQRSLRQQKQSSRKLLASALDPAAQAKLAQLRFGKRQPKNGG
jgi:uncharacterized protein